MATTLANEVKNFRATTLNYAASQPILWKNGNIFVETAIYCRLKQLQSGARRQENVTKGIVKDLKTAG